MKHRNVAAALAVALTVGGVAVTVATSSRAGTALTVDGIGSTVTVSTRAAAVPGLAAHAKIGGSDGNKICVQRVSGPGTLKARHATTPTGAGALSPSCSTHVYWSFAADAAGEYKVRVFADENGNSAFDQGIDRAAQLLTMRVADLVPTVTLRAPEDSMGTVTLDGTIKFEPQPTVRDFRGGTVLGDVIAAYTHVTAKNGPCGADAAGQGGNVTVTPPSPAVPVKFNGSQAFTFDLGTATLVTPHNGGTVKVTPTFPNTSSPGVADVAWLHSAKPDSVEVMRLGGQASPSGKTYPLGDRDHLNSVDLVARVSAPGPVRLECPLVDVTTSPGTWVLDGDNAVDSLHAATALIKGVNHPEIKTVEYVGSDLRFNAVVFTKTGPAKITVRAGDAQATITPAGAASTDPYVISAPAATLEQGKSGVLTGSVADAFGNPVPGTPVELSGVTGGVGVLDVASISTGADGTWSGRFAAADSPGTGAYSAVLPGVTPAGAGQWLGTSLTVPATVTAMSPSITVGATPEPTALSLTASGALAGRTISLSGTAPNGPVTITAKGIGIPPRSWTVTATGGTWTATYPATRTTTFVAGSGGQATAPVMVRVTTRMTALVVAQAGYGKVKIYTLGQPSAGARYWVSVNGKHKMITSVRVFTLNTGKGWKAIKVRIVSPGCTTGPGRTVVKIVR